MRATKTSNIGTQLLVAATTTSLQTPTTAEQKTQPKTQTSGCCCAKGLFHNNY